jgi:hypothetical protein
MELMSVANTPNRLKKQPVSFNGNDGGDRMTVLAVV